LAADSRKKRILGFINRFALSFHLAYLFGGMAILFGHAWLGLCCDPYDSGGLSGCVCWYAYQAIILFAVG